MYVWLQFGSYTNTKNVAYKHQKRKNETYIQGELASNNTINRHRGTKRGIPRPIFL